jgi:hypothetical protein
MDVIFIEKFDGPNCVLITPFTANEIVNRSVSVDADLNSVVFTEQVDEPGNKYPV